MCCKQVFFFPLRSKPARVYTTHDRKRKRKRKKQRKHNYVANSYYYYSLSVPQDGTQEARQKWEKDRKRCKGRFFFILSFCNPCVAYTSHEHSHLWFRILTSPSLLCSALKKQKTNKNGIGTAPATVPRWRSIHASTQAAFLFFFF